MTSRVSPRDRFKRGRNTSSIPGGVTRADIDYRSAPFNFSPDEETLTEKAIARARRFPMVSRDGEYLNGGELFAEIKAALPDCGVELPQKETDFLEDIEDRIRAHAEVRRPFRATRRQKQWLSDIWRRVHHQQPEEPAK